MTPTSNENIEVGGYIGKWKLIKKIANSGFNEIYLGKFESNEAIIKIPRSEEFWDKIDNEIQCLNLLDNKFSFFPHILDSYSANDETPWLALEVIKGENLKEVIKRNGPLEMKDWFKFAEELMKALSILESKKITHEDIKPTNIFYSNGELKIIDFGLARIPKWVNEKLYEDSSVIDSWAGTFEFSSPEHFSGEHVSEMDVFSAASTLVFAGSGRSPFFASNSSEWMKAINRDAPNFHNLTISQKKFLNPLFTKNKSERQTSKVCSDFLIKLNKSENLDENILFQSWPEFKNLTGNNFENDQVYQKLFKNRLQIKLIRNSSRLYKLIGNITLILIFYFIYIQPLNNILRDLPPKSLSEIRQGDTLAEIKSCLYDSYKSNISTDFKNPDAKKQQEKIKIGDVKARCQKIAQNGEPLGYIGLAYLNTDALTKERNLIQAAKIDPNDGFNLLIGFYSEAAYLNFIIYGEETLAKCTKDNDPFCLRIMGNMYNRIGLMNSLVMYKNDFMNNEIALSNEDIVKGNNYLRQAADLGDVHSAIDLANSLNRLSQPFEYLVLIEDAANKNNLSAMRWMYGQAVISGDNENLNKWKDKLKNDPNFILLDIITEWANKNGDKAFSLATECLKLLEPNCYSIYSSMLEDRIPPGSKDEIEFNYVLSAMMGADRGMQRMGELKFEQGNSEEAIWWLQKARTYFEADSFISLGDVFTTTNEMQLACNNYKFAAVLIKQKTAINRDNNYFRSGFGTISPFASEADEINNEKLNEQFYDTITKIESRCENIPS